MSIQASPAVVRAGQVLRHLAAHPTRAFSVSELARQVGIPRATCDSLLLGLAKSAFVRRDDARRYSLGPGGIALGDAFRAANPALRAASVHAATLARAHSTVTAVSLRAGDEARVTDVFDFGPPFGLRPRPGEWISIVPPFGASLVAWDEEAVEQWLQRAQPSLNKAEIHRYRVAIDRVRRRGYSVTLASERQQEFAEAVERAADQPEVDEMQRRRDQAVQALAHSDYLAVDIDPDRPVRLTQVSAPVFEADGTVTVSIMLLGPNHDVTASEIAVVGDLVVGAAAAATRDIGGSTRGQRPAL